MCRKLTTNSLMLLAALLALAVLRTNADTPTCPTGATIPGVGITVTILTTNSVGQTNVSVGGTTVGSCTPLWVRATLVYQVKDIDGNIAAGGSDGQVFITTQSPNTAFSVNATPASGIPLIGPAL